MSRKKITANGPSGRPADGPDRKQEPPVPIRKSITRECIICLECGKKQKMLKRHLSAAHGMSPEEYRAKWNLPVDYPMVAPAYAKQRSEFAKKIGLGRKTKMSPRKKK